MNACVWNSFSMFIFFFFNFWKRNLVVQSFVNWKWYLTFPIVLRLFLFVIYLAPFSNLNHRLRLRISWIVFKLVPFFSDFFFIWYFSIVTAWICVFRKQCVFNCTFMYQNTETFDQYMQFIWMKSNCTHFFPFSSFIHH